MCENETEKNEPIGRRFDMQITAACERICLSSLHLVARLDFLLAETSPIDLAEGEKCERERRRASSAACREIINFAKAMGVGRRQNILLNNDFVEKCIN